MKFIISENKLEKVIFRYLDNKNLSQVERYKSRIYFVSSPEDEFAKIMYDISDMWCYISYKLIDEVANVFNMKSSEARIVITKWVENILDRKIAYAERSPLNWGGKLKFNDI